MLYHFLATDKNGKFVEGEIDFSRLDDVLRDLATKELKPVSVTPIKQTKSALGGFFSRISISDKVFLTKYLALMLRVGTDLLSAINILIADFEKPAVKNFLLDVRENLTKGQPFHAAFAKYPKAFSPVFVNLVKAAENSGNLQQTFEYLSTSLEKQSQLQNKIKGALTYPIIILCAALVIFIFLVTFALPKIAKVFLEAGIKPPTFSRIVFSVGLYFNSHIFVILPGLFIVVVGGLFFFLKTSIGKSIGSGIIRHMPILKKVHRELAVQRFAATFSSLMKAGIPIVEAIHITAGVVGSPEFKEALERIGEQGLSKGLTIGEAFKRENVFPRVVTNLIAISEKAGHLDEVLNTLADFYADGVDANIKTLVSFLEPILLMGMGLLVGAIALSIILPIYQLTSQF